MYAEETFGVKIAELILYSRLTSHLRYPNPYSMSNTGGETWLGLEMEGDANMRAEIESRITNDFTLDIYLHLPKDASSGVDIRLESQVDGSPKTIKREKILLETWTLSPGPTTANNKLDNFVRALHCLLRLLPCYRLCRSLRKAGNAVLITYQFRNADVTVDPEAVGLEESILDEGITEVASTYALPSVDCQVKLSVQYRTNCRFQIKSAMVPGMDGRSPKERAFSFETVPSLQPEQPFEKPKTLRKVPSAMELTTTPPTPPTTTMLAGQQRRTSYPEISSSPLTKKQSQLSGGGGDGRATANTSGRTRSIDLSSFVRSLEMLVYAEHPTGPGSSRLAGQRREELKERYERLKERMQPRMSSPIREDESMKEEGVEEDTEIFPFAAQ